MSNVILSLGYDTERPYGIFADSYNGKQFRREQLRFINRLSDFLDEENVPRTFFILGDYLEKCLRDFSKDELRGIYCRSRLNDIQQHSYSHLIFRRIKRNEGKPIVSWQQFVDDVEKANQTLKKILDIDPIGLRTPMGYHHDLSDLPEMVEALSKTGLRFVSSDLRGEDSIEAKLTHQRQPHTYNNIGYNNIVEIPSHGWHDDIFTAEKAHKYLKQTPSDPEEILQHYTSLMKSAIEMSRDKLIYISLCLHPWAVMEYDPELQIHKGIIDKTRELQIKIIPYKRIAEEVLSTKL
ncbi:polysaccharide deacetylase family protein [Candidatus Woesearchaeota archaeon]|nr:polysaccharide deacetylase family protein [Candidatus Woesearchaeota archaeon]